MTLGTFINSPNKDVENTDIQLYSVSHAGTLHD